MNNMKNTLKIVAFCLGNWMAVHAQTQPASRTIPLQYSKFMDLVKENNIGYAAERFNVDISLATIEGEKVFPDPELSFEFFDNGERRKDMGYGFSSELEWTLELGGKRKARINVAKSEHELTKTLLLDYFKQLRADATNHYLTALQNKLLLDVQRSSYQSMKQLAHSDSVRFALGDISAVDAKQTKLEARTMLNEVFQAEAEFQTALVDLSLLMGAAIDETQFGVDGDFKQFDRQFTLSELIVSAQNNRTDLLAALQSKDVSQRMIDLAKANRSIDLGLLAGFEHNSEVKNPDAEGPAFTQFKVGVSIPLMFSNRRNQDVKIAQFELQQNDRLYRLAELEIQAEVTQAYYAYIAFQKQVKQYDLGLLEEAKAVLDGRTYSYQRGNTSLLEVLDAQRTYNEVHQTYYETLYNYANALVELERATGIWDIDF